MNRPPIPAELRRAILVEAGHRCAIPRCGQTELDIHHIVPWEVCNKHEYHNLIALCPICHRRAHKKEIDRKSLQIYKAQLATDALTVDPNQFIHEIMEIKRCIKVEANHPPVFSFRFEFPDFSTPQERIVSKNLEAWGNELLVELHDFQNSFDLSPWEGGNPPASWLRGGYRIVRRDDSLISIKYTLVRYCTGAAHRSQSTRVQNFFLNSFLPITLDNFIIQGKLADISSLVRNKLLEDSSRDEEWVLSGTKPIEKNFELINFEDWGVTFTFPEYQVGSYAEGEQEVFINYEELQGIADPFMLERACRNVL